MKVKVCGLSTVDQVITCTDLEVDFCGFILNYPKSHRHISFEKASELTKIKKNKSKYVGVLVNPNNYELEKFSKIGLDYFQIYGSYDNDLLIKIRNQLNIKIISAITVDKKSDVLEYEKIKNIADIVLWDSSGFDRSLTWNYKWIKSIPSNITKMIAGNIDIEKLEQISKLADIVDVSGALETNKEKDIKKIKNFVKRVKTINDKN
jgi:phosphoribosylanthranilate isomerase